MKNIKLCVIEGTKIHQMLDLMLSYEKEIGILAFKDEKTAKKAFKAFEFGPLLFKTPSYAHFDLRRLHELRKKASKQKASGAEKLELSNFEKKYRRFKR